MRRISKTEARKALSRYGIPFGFPTGRITGDLITVWTDHYHQTKGKTMELIHKIENDSCCPFSTSPDMMMNTFRINRKDLVC